MSNITIRRGETIEWDLPLVYSGTTTPVNLTGATVWLMAKSDTNLTDAAAEIHLDNGGTYGGITVAAPLTGIAHITLTAAQTHALVAGQPLFYTVKVKEASGRETVPDEGWFLVESTAVEAV